MHKNPPCIKNLHHPVPHVFQMRIGQLNIPESDDAFRDF